MSESGFDKPPVAVRTGIQDRKAVTFMVKSREFNASDRGEKFKSTQQLASKPDPIILTLA
jgi:hypothetical protein